MANGIANAILNMGTQFKPVSAFIQGQQAGLQNRLAQAQLGDIDQKNQLALRMQQARGLLPNPETRQQGIDELTTLGAIGEAKSAQDLYTRSGPKFGRPIQAIDESGKPVWVQIADTGEARPVAGFGPIPKSGMSVTTPDGTTVQIGGSKTPGGKKEQEELAKFRVGNYKEVSERGDTAETENRQLLAAKNLDVSTGALEPWKASVSAVAESFGVDPTKLGLENATNPQAFIGIMQNVVLNKTMKQKGTQSETDSKRIESTVASLGNTQAAKDFLLETAIALNQMDIEQRDFYQDYLAKNNTLTGAERAWRERMKGVPLLAKNPKTGLPVFYAQFKGAVMQANPGMTEQQVIQAWREKYGD